jgi:biopolymer transport protein ExbB
MNLVEWLKNLMVGFGAGWVLWLLVLLSVVSVAIILERAWFFFSLRDDLVVLAREFRLALEQSMDVARKRLERSASAEAAVVLAGLAIADKGPEAVEEAMAGASALQRMKLEKRLAYLATLGNNAPFIGLFGTVIGIVGAFEALGETAKSTMAEAAATAIAPQAVMTSIAEALVATAVGIFVAIPAVAANNYFQRATKSTLANTEALTRVLLSHLRAVPAAAAPAGDAPSGTPSSREPSQPSDSKRGKEKAAAKRSGGRGSDAADSTERDG